MSTSAQEKLLFLILSSVLVSSPSKNEESNRTYKSKRQQSRLPFAKSGSASEKFESNNIHVEDVMDLMAKQENTVPILLPTKQSQQSSEFKYSWTLWQDSKMEKGMTEEDYMRSMHSIGSFQSVSEFWNSWNHMKSQVPRKGSKVEANFRLFKSDVTPSWEDPSNVNGGKYIIVPPKNCNYLECWLSLIIALIIGELGFADQLTGAVFSIRPWGIVFSLWTGGSSEKRIADKVKEIFQVSNVKFQKHKISKSMKLPGPSKASDSEEPSTSEGEVSTKKIKQAKPVLPTPAKIEEIKVQEIAQIEVEETTASPFEETKQEDITEQLEEVSVVEESPTLESNSASEDEATDDSAKEEEKLGDSSNEEEAVEIQGDTQPEVKSSQVATKKKSKKNRKSSKKSKSGIISTEAQNSNSGYFSLLKIYAFSTALAVTTIAISYCL